MSWSREIDNYCLWLLASGASRETLRLRKHYLRRFAGSHAGGPWSPGMDDLIVFVANAAWKPETRKCARGTLRSFYGWALLTERIVKDPSVRLPSVRIPPPVPRPAPDCVLAHAMLAAGEREQLMLLLASLAGLRRAEIATLRVRDVVGDGLYLIGKGGKERYVPLHPTLRLELARELAGRLDGWMFPGQIDGHLSPGHVGVLLSRLLGPGWSGHKLRHRFATKAYAAERDLIAVQKLLGHAKPETTTRYIVLPDTALRTAVMAA
jgi:integrase/recombinase XerC